MNEQSIGNCGEQALLFNSKLKKQDPELQTTTYVINESHAVSVIFKKTDNNELLPILVADPYSGRDPMTIAEAFDLYEPESFVRRNPF